MLTETKVIEKKEEGTLSVENRGEHDKELTYFHVGADHNWEWSIMGLIVNVYLEEKKKISSGSRKCSRWGNILVRWPWVASQ